MPKLGMISWLTPPSLTPRKLLKSSLRTLSPPFTHSTSKPQPAPSCLNSCRNLFKGKNGDINNGFQQYITNFQNLSLKTRIKEDGTLIEYFSLGLDQKISTMIFSMFNILTTVNGWVDQAKIFHAQRMYILALWAGRTTPQAHFPSHHQ